MDLTKMKGGNVKSLKHQLLFVTIKKSDLKKVEEIIQRLEGGNYVITAGAYVQQVDLYCSQEKLDEALAVHNSCWTIPRRSISYDVSAG
jgi:hypothetical protein